MRKFMAAVIFAALILAGITPAMADNEKSVDIAASAPGGTWFTGLGAYAKYLHDTNPQYDTTLFSGGGVSNVPRVARNQSQIGITALPFMKAGLEGAEPFKSPSKILALGNLDDDTRSYFIVPKNSPFKTAREIFDSPKPQRVCSGSKVGGNSEVFFRWILDAFGTDPKKLKDKGFTIYNVQGNQATPMMQEGQIDALMMTNPGEHFALLELLRNMDLKILPIDEEALAYLKEHYGMLPKAITTDMYKPIVTEEIITASAPSGLVINPDISEEDAYNFAKALVEGRGDIALALPAWSSITPENICKNMPIDIHPGAAKYYKEIGCLK